MVYSSMKKLLAMFPYFLKKSPDSNFYKSESVFNEQFKGLYNDIFQVYESFHINKRLFVWKEQTEAYDYTINFVANYPYLKRVTCYKNDTVLYTEQYEYEDKVDTFIYSYDGHSNTIIPTDKFHITVETFEEYTLVKGFPENDESKGDIYDHDYSLDNFGELHNTSRKKYKLIDNGLSTAQQITYYSKTEPPFNNRTTEDDYHYMNRLLQYLIYFHKLPLPVIEIWKLYGLDPEDEDEVSFVNRERYLAKMFEESMHKGETGEYDPYWKRKPWEHKDLIWCPVKPDIFFFANVNNASPVQGMTITFDFDFIDEYARRSSTDYYIIPYLVKIVDDEITYVRYEEGFYRYTKTDGYLWDVNTNELPGIETEYEFDFIFRAYDDYQNMLDENDKYLESDIIKIVIKGCNNADYYVDCVDGSDNNDGKTRQTSFKTLEHALNQMHGSENVIALVNKNEYFPINNIGLIDEICSIISCPAGATIYQNNGWEFFKILQDCSLYLQNVYLKHKCCAMYSQSTDFQDKNALNYPIHVKIPKWICKIATKMVMTRSYTVHAHHELDIPGTLLTDVGDYEIGAEYVDGITRNCPTSTRRPNEPVPNETVKLYLDNTVLDTDETNNNGDYEFEHTFETLGDFKLRIIHDESTKYCDSEDYCNVKVIAMPTKLSITKPAEKMYIEDSFTVPYNVKNYYNEAINFGTLKLYEDNQLVKTIQNGEELTYTPTTDGMHWYRLEWSYDNTYETSKAEFRVEVIKYATSLFLLGEGKSIYLADEDVKFTGTLKDEFNTPLAGMQVRVFDNNTHITTLTTDNNGEVHFSDKLSIGKHTLNLDFLDTSKYYSCYSNNYRVRVRDNELPDIQLYLYPEHKILGSKLESIPVHVYACNSQGEPLSTSFKLWNTYSSACETNTSPAYNTGNDGWWSGNLTTQAIVKCEGIYLQAVSTLDEDVYSNVSHIRYTVEPELEVTPTILVDKSVYSYNNEVINITGDLIDEEEDPVPNENLTVKVYADNTVVKTFNLTTDLRGEFNAAYTTNSNVRGKDLRFELTYSKHNGAYAACSDEVTVIFKQLATTVNAENISLPTSRKITITGSVIDENNIPADLGNVTITLDGTTYSNVNLVNGAFSLTVDKLLTPTNYPVTITYPVNTCYKTSSKDITVSVTKVTPNISISKVHEFIVDETGNIPYRFTLPSISPHTTSNIPLTGTISILKSDNTPIVSGNVNARLNVVFDTKQVINNCKLVYSGNDYLNSVTITGITLIVNNPSIIINDTESGPWDINIIDEFPQDTSSYDEDDYLIRTQNLDDNRPKLTITDDPDYDTSNSGEDDIILIDSEDTYDVVIKDEDDD